MNPLSVYDVIIPSNHIARSKTAIVQSMVTFLFIVLHRSSHAAARLRANRADNGRKSNKLPFVASVSIPAGRPFPVFMPVAIASLPISSVIVVPLVPLRIAVRVTVRVLSTISAASSQRHQHCQK